MLGVGLLMFGLAQFRGGIDSVAGPAFAHSAGWSFASQIEIASGAALITAGVLGLKNY